MTRSIDLEEVGEFLQLTSKLILLKSEHLLPHETAEVQDEEIAERVRPALMDRADIAVGASYLAERHGQESFAPLPHPYTVERPVEPRPASLLSRTWEQMQKRSGDAVLRVAAPAFLRLEVAVSTIIRNLRSGRSVRLGLLLRHASRQDAVMHFLAVLELVRRRQATAEQQGLFEDIVIERAEPVEDDLASRAG
jgi:chromatin segregation and condensation protein Rec8/ScpA/Scc1 (kleisin family)